MINILLSELRINEDWAFPVLKSVLTQDTKVLILPYSFSELVTTEKQFLELYQPQTGFYWNSLVEPFHRYGITDDQIEWVNCFQDSFETIRDRIAETDCIVLPGGFPELMYRRLEQQNLIKLIQAHTGIVLGFSAGAMIQLKEYHITPDDQYEFYQIELGLNLVRGFDVEVHFNHQEEQLHSIYKAVHDLEIPVYALRNDGGLLIDGDEIVRFGKTELYTRSTFADA